ncbi:hypothetical protein B6V73_00085 [Thioclava sp. JM3]|uniref:hypothetical protein n=1 Tax=Thioclava sp. JM3 TaxID=1973004 RepID=UPI000B5491BE|nr:hypothetical protein [Thioclava sp. JM3]OWY18254.1 hypothetical protein B6V73_00085 [Thioclava sp. JM3]
MNFNELELSASEIVEATGRTARWVQHMAAKGYFERRRRGHYSTVSVLGGLSRFYDEQTKAKEVPSTRQRIDEAKAREVEIRIAQRQRELIPQVEALDAMGLVVEAATAELTKFHMKFRDPVRSLIRAEALASIERINAALRKAKASIETGDKIEGRL